jgi:hypothetical protein
MNGTLVDIAGELAEARAMPGKFLAVRGVLPVRQQVRARQTRHSGHS